MRRVLHPSRIALRLLAFNLLLLFLPIAGVLYLDVYEARLLEAQERSMVQQARLVAAALGDGEAVEPALAIALLQRLEERSDARLRIYDAAGVLVADSARLRLAAGAAAPGEQPYGGQVAARSRVLYRIGAWIATARRRVVGSVVTMLLRPRRPLAQQESDRAVPSEVSAALAGRYGAATSPTPNQRSLTLNSAVPIKREARIIGAVQVSQTTFRVLQALYEVRLRTFEIVLASLLAAAVLTTIAAATVVRPLARLRRTALDLAGRRTRLPGTFVDARRRDEIGDLARSLEELTRRLHEHIQSVEHFASDVAHEFRNPLAAIRTAAEMAAAAESAGERERFLHLLTRDADRLERLVADLRELARIDAQLEQEPLHVVDLAEVLAHTIQGVQLAAPGLPRVELTAVGGPCRVRGSADRLAQVLENVLSNARSFAPAGCPVRVTIARERGICIVTVSDTGPGIPDAHLERVFDRFFSYRPGTDERGHAGLGLAIARTIVTGYGGSIVASNQPQGGAAFEIRLPMS